MSGAASPLVRAVLDSSVLVAGWSRLVLQRLASTQTPKFEPVWSEWIIAEVWRVLTWRACQAGATRDETSARANAMLRRLLPVMRHVSLRDWAGPAWAELVDPNDEPVWATAVLAGAQYVVSDNTSDFPPPLTVPEPRFRGGLVPRHVHNGIEYLTAIEFVEDILGEDARLIYGAELPRVLPRSGRTRSPLLP